MDPEGTIIINNYIYIDIHISANKIILYSKTNTLNKT